MTETVRFERRFQGFTDGALGGYVAGMAARGIEGPAEANLRALPPMERELQVERDSDRAALHDGDTLVLEVARSEFDLELPATPTLDEAVEANRHLIHEEYHHLYPGCFTCGPDRDDGDGLRLFMGHAPVRDDLLIAAWTPSPQLVDGDELPSEFVWAALDCPTIWAAWLEEDGAVTVPQGTFSVLARQRVEHHAAVPLGEPAIVTSWAISHDGRKHVTAAAIHSPDGALLARGESLLIDVVR
jgi:hypothetical protein